VLAYAGLDMFERRQWLTPRAARGWRRMRASAAADGIELLLVSAYRSIRYQTVLFQRKFARGLTLEDILAVNAAPGYSEHHTGRALDLTCPGSAPAEEIFETTRAFAWLTQHAAEFGFRMSYPRGNPHGILYEPWHWCHDESLLQRSFDASRRALPGAPSPR
jgi:D-alanyl-D-alanine carboxypeptidase